MNVLADHKAIHEARSRLAEQVGNFTLERISGNREVSFKANAEIDFFGEEASTQLSGAGAGLEHNRSDVHFRFKIQTGSRPRIRKPVQAANIRYEQIGKSASVDQTPVPDRADIGQEAESPFGLRFVNEDDGD